MLWKPSELTHDRRRGHMHRQRVTAAHGLPNGIFNIAIGEREISRADDQRRAPAGRKLPVPSARQTRVASRCQRKQDAPSSNSAATTPSSSAKTPTCFLWCWIVFGAVGTAGQRSRSTRRIIAQRSIVDTLCEQAVKAYRQVPIGDPLDSGTLMGPLVNQRAVDNMLAWPAQRNRAARCCAAGVCPTSARTSSEPTIISMPQQTPLVCDETFAPILYVMAYDTLDEALELHNGVPSLHRGTIFTANLLSAEQFSRCRVRLRHR
ncbi:MAG: aldehyde dehydrogenase family protein [Anaerolineae bacterium]